MFHCIADAVLLIVLMALLVGCGSRTTVPAPASGHQPADAGATDPTVFSSKRLGVELTIPAGWISQPSVDHVLMLIYPPANEPSDCSISLDVPDLPVHFPGLIPIGMVKNGYIDDLRKKFPQVQIEQDPTAEIPQAQARLVRSTWQDNGRRRHETALLMVQGDHVYILRAKADAARYGGTIAVFDAIAKSIRWIK
ncbi:MAG: hypothetical protein NTU53_07380 [Planctomycetota bacterium]|nr:hypothetical protein [Planctomycetota bacterium]